jgi:hypothetical protein
MMIATASMIRAIRSMEDLSEDEGARLSQR